jgi:hypothetical protein
MSTKAKWISQLLHFWETATQETTDVMCPVWMKDDFYGKNIDTTNLWVVKSTGTPTAAAVIVSGQHQLDCNLAATSEIELAGLTQNDQKNFILNQNLFFEAKIQLQVTPTGVVKMGVGLCGNHNAALLSIPQFMMFVANGSGALTLYTSDGTLTQSAIATGITLGTSDWAIVKIDASDITNVKFYINGNQVAAGTTFNMSTSSTLALQPTMRIGKESATTDVGRLITDYVQVWSKRT